MLWFLGWDGAPLPAAWWAVILLAVGVALAFLMSMKRRDWAYILVLIWAYAGIAAKQADTPLVANAAWVGVVLLAVLAVSAILNIPRRKG